MGQQDSGLFGDATAHWNFAGSKNLLGGSGPAFTTVRAGNARLFNSAGLEVTASTNIPRFDHDQATLVSLGLLDEMARTKSQIHSRDFTNAAWVKTNITAAKDATGIDGVASSASTLTAAAGNGTALQTVTIASAEFTTSVYVKRKTGTGDIDITDDNGANWTTLTGLSSSVWTRYDITRTQANPIFGFRIVTSGDEIEVDHMELEDGADPTSTVPTVLTALVRAGEVHSVDVSSVYAANQGMVYWEAILPALPEVAGHRLLGTDGTGSSAFILVQIDGTDLRFRAFDGTNITPTGASALVAPSMTPIKFAVSWGSRGLTLVVNGGAELTNATVDLAALNTATGWYIGQDNAGTFRLERSWHQEGAYFNFEPSVAFMQQLTS